MQQEIQRLNSAQGDISSYQKQQQAIEATTRKLERLKEQQRLLNKQKEEMRAAGQSTTALEREEKKLEQTVDNTNTKLQQQQQKLTATGDRLRQAGVDTNNLTSESKRLEQEMGQLKSEQEKVAQSSQEMGQSMAEAMDAAAAAMAAAGIVQGLREIYDAFAECVNVAAEFEATMSTVEALSGASGGEMEELSAKAKELGATTVFTAQEAGDAMSYMGMAGWKAQDMISGMDGVLNLAAASGEDLAMVSDIVTDNLTAFGLKASDTSRFADVLAAAATNSNTSVSIMGETFKQSAAIAGALGYSVEDVAVAVGLMANAGVKGSIAGTALKNTFNGLLEGATLTGEAFGEYEFSALKADGTMKDFASTINELRGVFSQMTEAERVQNAMTLASARGYNGLLAILNATEEDYTKLTGAINDCAGAAERMAQIKLDNLKGDLALANSAAEAFKDSVGSALIPVLRDLVQAGTEGLSWAAEFAEQYPAATAALAAFVAVVGTAVAALTAYAAIVKVVSALNLAALFSGPLLPIVALAGGLTALAVGIKTYTEKSKESQGEAASLTAASRKQYYAIQDLNAQYEQARSQYGDTSSQALELKYQLDSLTAAYESGKNTVDEFTAANKALADSHAEIMQSMRDGVDSAKDEELSMLALVQKLDTLSGKSNRTATEQQQMLAIIDSLNQSVPSLAIGYDEVTGSMDKSTEAIKRAVKVEAERQIQAEKMEGWIELSKEELRLRDQMTEAEHNYALALQAINSAGFDVDAPFAKLAIPPELLSDYETYASELEMLRGLWDENQAALADFNRSQEGAAGAMNGVQGAITNVETALGNLSTAYTEAYAAAQESFQGQFGLFEEAATVTATSFDTIIKNLESQKEYWANYGENFNVVQQAAQNAEVDISGILSRLSDGSPEAAAGIAGLADEIRNSTDGGKKALTELEEAFSGAQSQMGEAAQSVASASGDVQTALSDLQTAVAEGAQNLDMPEQFQAAMVNNLNAVTEAFSSGEGISEAMSALQNQISEGLNAIDVTGAMAGLQGQMAAEISSIDVSGEATAAGNNAGTQYGTSYTESAAQSIAQGGAEVSAAVGQVGTQVAAQGQQATTAMQETMTTGATAAMQAATDATTSGGQALASAAAAAATAAGSSFSSSMSPGTFGSAASTAMQAAINAVNSKRGALVAAARSAAQAAAAAFAEIKASISGFAGGTRSAPQGLAWVGEKGPELVYFHGGETIIPGSATVTALHQAAMLVGTHGPELMYMQGGETVIPAGQTQTILSQHQKELETINAYASGTDNAERGLALVGEHGPELMYMQGGETVIPAADTMRTLQANQLTPGSAEAVEPGISQAVIMLPQAMEAMTAYYRATERTKAEAIRAERMDRIMESIRNYDLRGSGSQDGASGSDGTPVVVNFNVTINGTASNDVLSQLRAFAASEEFRGNVRDAVQEAERDRMRRAYR